MRRTNRGSSDRRTAVGGLPWSLSFRLARRELWRRPVRSAMVVGLVVVVVAAVLCGDLAYRSRRDDGVAGFGHSVVKISARITPGDTRNPQQLAQLTVPAGMARVLGWEAAAPVPVERTDNLALATTATLWTVDLTDPMLRGVVQVDAGTLPADKGQVLLGTQLAAALRLQVGETLHLARPRLDLRVVGIGDSVGERDLLVAPGYPVEQLAPEYRVGIAYLPSLVDDPRRTPEETTPPAVGFGFLQRARVTHNSMVDLLIGWLVALLVLSVLGIVVSSAFAASGRRQLVALGQLGAAGADRRFLRRVLALQGAVTGAVGGVLGVVVGWRVASAGSSIVAHGVWDLPWVHPMLLVVTTVAVAVASAVVPTRRLAGAPVLVALSGRAPVADLWRGQLRWGAIAVGWGLLVLGLSVLGTFQNERAASTMATIFALVGGGSVLAGVCALCPVAIDRWGRLSSRTSGSARLALRSLARNRARSAAIVAAIVAIAAGGVAGASTIERWHPEANVYNPGLTRLDVVEIRGVGAYPAGTSSLAQFTAPVPEPQKVAVESVVGPVRWYDVRFVASATSGVAMVADQDLLVVLGVPVAEAAHVLERGDNGGDGSFIVRQDATPGSPSAFAGLAVPSAVVISPARAAARGMHQVGSGSIGFASAPITDAQRTRLLAMEAVASSAKAVFGGRSGDGTGEVFGVSFEEPYRPIGFTRTMARWTLIAGLLLAVTLVVAFGLLLWAAEGRDERDQLVALGAAPRSLAWVAAQRAWVLSATGATIAVPVGLGALWAVMHSLDRPVPIPVVTVVMLVVALPLLAGGVSFVGSLVAQTVRPATGARMSLD
jgi:hypothetical protein